MGSISYSYKTIHIISVLLLLILSSCSQLIDTEFYESTVIEYTEAMIAEEYDRCMDLMAIEHESYQHIDINSMKASLPDIREALVSNFGEDLKYTATHVEKVIFGKSENGLPPNTTGVLIQFENQEEFGHINAIFDNETNKMINWSLEEVRESIPSMLPFWLFGLLAICVPLFNIYVINLIRKSNLTRKWLKYLMVILLNIPSVYYTGIGEFGIQLGSSQVILGISFSYVSYIYSSWIFGVPIGGLYWYRKLKQGQAGPASSNLSA